MSSTSFALKRCEFHGNSLSDANIVPCEPVTLLRYARQEATSLERGAFLSLSLTLEKTPAVYPRKEENVIWSVGEGACARVCVTR